MLSAGSGMNVDGTFWDADEPVVGVGARAARAAWVAGAWVLALLPMALGWQHCPIATFLHHPCPGCGLTRATRLLLAGDTRASLHLHPLALPVLVAGALLVLSTVWATLVLGSPVRLFRSRFGRSAVAIAGVVYAAAIVLWGLRWFGFWGGPVPV